MLSPEDTDFALHWCNFDGNGLRKAQHVPLETMDIVA
jgi:hypothetical protein